MKVFGLIGFPLSHSFSKKYFSEKFIRENIPDCRYELFPLKDISAFADLWKNNPELLGVNVTIPFKEKQGSKKQNGINSNRLNRGKHCSHTCVAKNSAI